MPIREGVEACKPPDDCQNSLKASSLTGGREIELLCTVLFYNRMIGLIVVVLKLVEIPVSYTTISFSTVRGRIGSKEGNKIKWNRLQPMIGKEALA